MSSSLPSSPSSSGVIEIGTGSNSALVAPAAPASSVRGSRSNSGSTTTNTQPTSSTNDNPQGLSAKDLKALKKKEKQAKRAAQKEASGIPPKKDNISSGGGVATSTPSTPHTGPIGGGSNQSTPGRGQQQPQHKKHDTTLVSTGSVDGGDIHVPSSIESRLPLFAHLENSPLSSFTSKTTVPKDVHPAILQLGLQFSSYKIIGSTARCRAMLEAFKQVIADYSTPQGTTLSRNLTSQLSNQIDFLKTARPLSISMGNSIRWLKQQISKVSIDISENSAKDDLIESISIFIRERIDIADKVIMDSAAHSINDGDVILTYAMSNVVKQSLIEAFRQGKTRIKVIVVDSRPLFEGKTLVRELVSAGLQCTYVLINALPYVIQNVTTVFLGAHAMFSNGQLYSRVGTAVVATSAQSRNIPVIVLCETIKFSDRVQLDAVSNNELAPIEYLSENISIDPLENTVPSPVLGDLSNLKNLSILNILYDLTHQSAIKKVITEVGSLPASSVPVILREYRAT